MKWARVFFTHGRLGVPTVKRTEPVKVTATLTGNTVNISPLCLQASARGPAPWTPLPVPPPRCLRSLLLPGPGVRNRAPKTRMRRMNYLGLAGTARERDGGGEEKAAAVSPDASRVYLPNLP